MLIDWLFTKDINEKDLAKNLSNNTTHVAIIRTHNLYLLSTSVGEDTISEAFANLSNNLHNTFTNVKLKQLSYDSLIVFFSADSNGVRNTMKTVIRKTVRKSLKDPISPFRLILKCGISTIQDINNISTPIKNALVALNAIGSIEYSVILVHSEIKDKLESYKDDADMASYFLSAHRDKRLQLFFQPVIDTKTLKTISFEALLRIRSKNNEILSAGPFILIAEKLGFIHYIDQFVLKCAAKKLIENPTLKLAVNISSLTIENGDWIKTAKRLFKSNNIAERLTIELTETALPQDNSVILKFIHKVKGLGCKIAIDDFGSGNTSFKQLKTVKADILKIDGIFIKDINHNPDSILFVKTLLEFARAHNLTTVAEFVETEEIARTLMKLGVDCMQGYYFGQATEQI